MNGAAAHEWPDLDPRRKRLTLIATIVGSTVVFIDSTIVNVALPALQEDFDAGLATQQWVIEAYLLTLGGLLLLGGSLGDLRGRRRIFIIGLAGFGVTSIACAAAPTGETLIAARALQGAAGALLVPSSLAIITATWAPAERGAAIGSWTAWTGIGIIIGPLVGGFLIEAVSWRMIFALNVPLVLGGLYLAVRFVPESSDPDGCTLDWVGALLVTLGLEGAVFALTEQPLYGWGDPLVAIPLAFGVVFLGAFVWWERRHPDPMVPLGLFRSGNFAAGNAATLLIYGALSASLFVLSIFLQQAAGYSAVETGLALAPPTLIMFLLSRRFGTLADRHGPRWFMSAGPLVVAAGLALGLRIDEDASYVADVLPPMLLFGLGLSITVAPLTAAVLGAVDEKRAGIASGINNAIARVAGLVAIALVGAVVSAQFASAVDDDLSAEPVGAAGRDAVEAAKEQPLEGGGGLADDPALGAGERDRVSASIDDASVSAFHVGLVLSAALAAIGGLIAAIWVRNRPRAREAAVP